MDKNNIQHDKMNTSCRKTAKSDGSLLHSQGGFSLVELLIAITILSIIAAPLLHSIVSALNTNAKSRKTMQATQIAEDVMEEFEAHSIEEMEDKYAAAGYSIDYNGVANKGYIKLTGTDSSASSGSYNVEIELDSSAYKNAAATGINDMEIADVQNLSGTSNAVYMDSAAQIQTAYSYFTGHAQAAESLIKQHIDRYIDIKIGSEKVTLDLGTYGTSVVDVYTVTASVSYKIDTPSYLDSDASAEYIPYPNDYVLFSNDADVRQQAEDIKNGVNTTSHEVTSRLANIVLCLSPRAESTNPGKNYGTDYIKVTNSQNVDTNLYLVMQDASTDAVTDYAIDNCKVQYQLYEDAGAWMSGDPKTMTAHCSLRTNLLENTKISYGYYNIKYPTLGGTSTASVKTESGSGKWISSTSSTSSKWVYTPELTAGAYALQIMQADSLVPTQKYNRIYEITVRVYSESDTTNPIISMTGTVTDNVKAD